MHPFTELEVPRGSIGIHWFGQSSFALRSAAGEVVQIDPYFPAERPADTYLHRDPPLVEKDLPTDFVVVTHDHGDHTCAETIGRIAAASPAAHYVGPSESIEHIRRTVPSGAELTVVTAGDRCALGTMTLHAVWSKPPDGAPADGIDPPNVQHLGYVIDAEGVRVYVSGDPINTFAEHESLLAPIRALRPDVGLMTCHPNEGEFPFFEGSVKSAVEIGLRTAIPAHYQCFVKRNYDPADWASHFPSNGPETLIVGYNESVVYRPPT